MSLYRFELKKILSNKTLIISIIIFTLINLYKIFSMYCESDLNNKDFVKFNSCYYSIYEGLKGEITQEKLSAVIDNYSYTQGVIMGQYDFDENTSYSGNPYIDANVFLKIFEDMNYYSCYEENNNAIVKNAKENLSFYKSIGNAREEKLNKAIVKTYAGRKINSYYNLEYTEDYIKYDFSSLLVIIIIVLGLAPVFSREKETGMNLINQTSQMGGYPLIRAKLLASLTFVFSVALWFCTMDLICFKAFFSVEGFSMPLYAIKSFEFCSFNKSIRLFVLISFALKVIFFFIIALITLLLSSKSKESATTFVLSLIIPALFIIANVFLEKSSLMYSINPANLLTFRQTVDGLNFINIFGRLINVAWLSLFFTASELFALVLLVIRLSGKITPKEKSI